MNFFNRATNAVETMGKNVSKAAKDNMEIMKCSSAIDSCKEKIEWFIWRLESGIIILKAKYQRGIL